MSPPPKRRTGRLFFPAIPKPPKPLVKAINSWQSAVEEKKKVFHFVRHAEAEHK
jgi:hypothetical protein